MRSWFAIVTLCAGMAAWPAAACWDGGHMQIAALAYDRLDPAVRTKVDGLVKLNPDCSKWIDGVADADRDRFAFVHASTWADDIKDDAGYTDSGDTPTSHNAARNIGYADKLRHKYWHYLDLPFSPDSTAVRPPDPVNALTQIKALTTALASKVSDDLKSYDLVWLIHLVGDAHQPLHATSRFTAVECHCGFDLKRQRGDRQKEEGNAELVCDRNPVRRLGCVASCGLVGRRPHADRRLGL